MIVEMIHSYFSSTTTTVIYDELYKIVCMLNNKSILCKLLCKYLKSKHADFDVKLSCG